MRIKLPGHLREQRYPNGINQERTAAAAPPATALQPAPMPAYKKKDMIRAEVDRSVDRLARMQCRHAGKDNAQARGKRQAAISTDLMRRFGARPDCTTSTLKRVLDHLDTEIKKEAARDAGRRGTRSAR